MNKSKASKQPNNLTPADISFYSNHFEKYKRSGMSQASYCQQQGIKYNTFVYVHSQMLKAKMHISPTKVAAKFIPVKANNPTAVAADDGHTNQENILLRLPNDFTVELPIGLLPEQMSSVFKVLGII